MKGEVGAEGVVEAGGGGGGGVAAVCFGGGVRGRGGDTEGLLEVEVD